MRGFPVCVLNPGEWPKASNAGIFWKQVFLRCGVSFCFLTLGGNTCLLSSRTVPLARVFPLRLSPLRRSLLGHSSSGVSPEFHKSDCFSQKHLDRHSFIFFSSPLRLSLSTVFLLYLFIYFSFILSHYPHVRQNNVLVVATNRPRL